MGTKKKLKKKTVKKKFEKKKLLHSSQIINIYLFDIKK